MNRAQAAFLASLFIPFILLALIQRALVSSLNAKGIYFGDLILIGLPKDVNHPERGIYTLDEFLMTTKAYLNAVDIPGVGTVDLLSPPVLGAVAVLLATLLYATLFSKGMLC